MQSSTPSWVSDAIFYQIFPDRFARSGRVNTNLNLEDWNSPPTTHGFKGGDLYGVAEHLDELSDLGVNALYLNPIFASACNHRYHTYDYFQVDPLLGGNDAFRFLLSEAHHRGIRIVLDGVFNHASRGFWQFHHVLENGAASPYRDWFCFDPERMNGQRPFLPYPDADAAEELRRGRGSLEAIGYSAWWNLPALPKFNVATPAVREFLLTVAEHWIRFGIDGWRLDVPNEIDDDDFWRDFRRRVRAINPEAWIVGEVWGDARHWLQGDMWDAVMNYQVTAACLAFFGGAGLDFEETRRPSSFGNIRPIDAGEFAAELDRIERSYPEEVTRSQLNLLDSHDMPRFLTCVRNDKAALRMAWLLLCTLPGAPCIYYGDEIGLDGRHDPDCRKAYPQEPSLRDEELRQWYRECIQLRKRCKSLRHGARRTLLASADICVFLHQLDDELIISAWNRSNDSLSVTLEDEHVVKESAWIQWPDDIMIPVTPPANRIEFIVPARSAWILVNRR